MTAPIGAIGAGLPIQPPVTPAPASPAAGTSKSGFADAIARGLENLQALHTQSDQLAVQAATGDLTDVHQYTIAATEATLATQLTVAVRNKAVDAFNEIMRMQM